MLITPELLKRLAGDRAYARGLDYFHAGAVDQVRCGKRKTTAIVQGSRAYQVTLEHTSARLGGHCDCPASEGVDFCKHCVATALELERQQLLSAAMGEGSEEARVAAYLQSMDKASLESIALDLIAEDRQRLARWALRAEAAGGELKPAALKKRITKALPYRQLWGYPQVRSYFQAAEELLDEVFSLLPALPASEAIKLVEYGYARLNKALEKIDDSGGFRLLLESQLEEQLAAALNRLDVPLSDKVGYLLGVVDWPYDVTPSMEALLDEATLAKAFFVEAHRLWEGKPGAVSWQLSHLLEQQAEQDRDWSRLIAYRSAKASHFHEFATLVDLNLRLQDFAAAEHWLERMQAQAKGWQREACREKRVSILRARGDHRAAWDLQWTLFGASLEVKDYLILEELAEALGEDPEHCATRAEALLLAHAQRKPTHFGDIPSEALMAFYLQRKAIDAAVKAAGEFPVVISQLLQVAKLAFECHPETAFGFYQRAILKIAEGNKKSSYEEVVGLLRQLQDHLRTLQDNALDEAFQRLLQQLRESQKRKRNLMKLLEQAFPIKG